MRSEHMCSGRGERTQGGTDLGLCLCRSKIRVEPLFYDFYGGYSFHFFIFKPVELHKLKLVSLWRQTITKQSMFKSSSKEAAYIVEHYFHVLFENFTFRDHSYPDS